MYNRHDPHVLPMRDGVNPSCIALPSSGDGLLLDFLTQRLPIVSREGWMHRIGAGEVVSEWGVVAQADQPFVPGVRWYYYRDIPFEPKIPFDAQVLYQDAHLLVADKPHFLSVVPAGRFLQETLLVRLKRELNLVDLSPIHRIDRDTAGLVMFSVQRETRGAYQALFRDRAVRKTYEAVAPWHVDLTFPRTHRSRMEESPQFFRMHEVAGEPNSHTDMDIMAQQGAWARYRLAPVTGKRHQLRVHMAALGLPLCGDPLYPEVNDVEEGDYANPLQLLAKTLEFTDPVTGAARYFESQRALRPLEDFAA